MGLSIAAATGAAFAHLFGGMTHGLIAGLPTLAVGLVWGVLLRIRATVGRSRIRWGWLASLPLAAANGGLAAALLFAIEERSGHLLMRIAAGAFLGVTFGAIFWVPGLLATLAFFGLPVARAQGLAEQGLAGEERGERVVGVASAILAGAGLLGAVTGPWRTPPAHHEEWLRASYPLESAGAILIYACALLGIAAGLGAVTLATARARSRRRFVDAVEAGEVDGYRVDAAATGKVLVRVAVSGEGYRVADVEEEIVAIDDAGEAIRELAPGPRPTAG